jgi:hypothetical protein
LAGKVYEEMEEKIEVRSLPYKNYVSFYRVTNDVVENTVYFQFSTEY